MSEHRAPRIGWREVFDESDAKHQVGLQAGLQVEDILAQDLDGPAADSFPQKAESILIVVDHVILPGLDLVLDSIEEAAIGAADFHDNPARRSSVHELSKQTQQHARRILSG